MNMAYGKANKTNTNTKENERQGGYDVEVLSLLLDCVRARLNWAQLQEPHRCAAAACAARPAHFAEWIDEVRN